MPEGKLRICSLVLVTWLALCPAQTKPIQPKFLLPGQAAFQFGMPQAHHWLRLGHCVTFSDAKEPLQHHFPAWLGLPRLLLRLGCSIFQGLLSLPGVDPGTPIAVLRAGVKEAPQGSILGSEEETEKGHNDGMVQTDSKKPSPCPNPSPEPAAGTSPNPWIRNTLPGSLCPHHSPSCWKSRAVPAWPCAQGWMALPCCPPGPCSGSRGGSSGRGCSRPARPGP